MTNGKEPTSPEPLLLTIPQVAELLQLSKSKVYLLAARGELPSIRIGRSIRVRPATLKKWVDTYEQEQNL